MLIEGALKSGKTSHLIEEFINLINSGVKMSEILVITANSHKKSIFSSEIREKLALTEIQGFGNLPVYTFNGIVYNSINNNWPKIEKIISPKGNNSVILPSLSGLESTEYILKLCIDELNQNEDISNSFNDYFSQINLVHQFLRRYRLITENNLDDIEITEKSELLGEQSSEIIRKVFDKLRQKTLNLRSFDYLKQTNTFLYLLKNNQIEDFNNIKYLFVDDFDEMTYSAQFFVKHLISQLNEYYIAADADGGTRRGYLCAYPQGWQELKQELSRDIINKTTLKKISNDAIALYDAIKNELNCQLSYFDFKNTIKRSEMIDKAIQIVNDLVLKQDIKPEDIAIIAPVIDENIKYSFKEFFELNEIQYQILTGSKKLFDNEFVFGAIIMAQLASPEWKLPPAAFEIRKLLTGILQFPTVYCDKIIEKYGKNKTLKALELENEELQNRYNHLLKIISECEKLSVFFRKVFIELFSPLINDYSLIEDFNLMIKSLDEFIELSNKVNNPKNPEKEWIIQTKNTVVSDNPPSSPSIKPNSIILSTPQKVIDLEIETKVQIWLDFSTKEWTKDDTGPFYNSWVFQKSWNEEFYTPEIHHKLTMEKTAHVLRKLILCVNEKIICLSSQLDSTGNENTGILFKYINNNQKKLEINYNFTPREDQKAVLDYAGGRLAVPAVPGAGKTTVNEALIIKLLMQGIDPEQILVLTYMESAARNVVDKLKSSCPNLSKFPVIKTIHGLAHSIIKENDHYSKVGLSSDFEVCDDSIKIKIIEEICTKNLPAGEENTKDWLSMNIEAISCAKLAGITPNKITLHLQKNKSQELAEFFPIYNDYIVKLRELGLVDFDDLLSLSVRLLRENNDIKTFYQKQFKYIIEDEAQDSSAIQQELITLLSDYYGNLVRTGDVNQAITTTFSNADVEGFRTFIRNNPNVEMKYSQRCAKEIYELANHLIDWTLVDEDLKNAFFPIKMFPVDGQNPVMPKSTDFKIYETPEEEQNYILNEIVRLKQTNPEYTFAILPRTNPSVLKWAKILETNDIPFICFTDALGEKKIFRFILKFFETLANPWDNKLMNALFQEFRAMNFVKKDFESMNFLNNIGSPFISFDLTELPTENLVRFRIDMQYWIENSILPAEELILKIGTYYFSDITDKSNIQMFSTLITKYKSKFTNYEENKTVNLPEIIEYFKDISKRNRIGRARFFDEKEEDDLKSGIIQVMTVHKAKGLGFDAVFMPEMHENMYSYSITPENISISNKKLITQLRKISGNNGAKTESEYKKEQTEEHLRLIYVGITRAKRRLYMTSSYKIKKRYKTEEVQPSKVLEHLISVFKNTLNKETKITPKSPTKLEVR